MYTYGNIWNLEIKTRKGPNWDSNGAALASRIPYQVC